MMTNWYLPITVVPGIGLLILSTSNLMITLSGELNNLIASKNSEESNAIIARKLIQLKTLNRTMVFFYLAVACLAIAALIGALQLGFSEKVVLYTSVMGIVTMLLGLLFLIKYSYKAVSIRQDQFKNSLNQ